MTPNLDTAIIDRIFRELNIEGDIGFTETLESFWQRKLIEVYQALKDKEFDITY